ncbi:MAG: outer membrane beta-barrel protein, partial [Gemmataceae bacterium]
MAAPAPAPARVLSARVRAAPAPAAPAEAPAEAPKEADKFLFMKALEGTAVADSGFFITGWLNGSYNATTVSNNNLPLSWTDRANRPMFQQGWVRFGKAIDTTKDEVQFGFQVDVLYGSDYRFTLPRGLFNGQLQNANGDQNFYGFDPIQHYASVYIPSIFEGTEFRVGRLYTPWGVESLEAVSTPLVTRSYAFNNCPPFTHSGVGMYTTFSKEWSGTFMVVNGNDIYFGASGEEWRGVGALKWTQPESGDNTITVAASVGRGAFNQNKPFAATTVALANEPFGRNNFNAFDIVWTSKLSDCLSTAVEAIYGYQTNVPPGAAALAANGTAHWASVAGYVFYDVSDEVRTTLRLEAFDDFQGSRTGFEGLYTAATAGISYKPCSDLIFRTEVRYDYNHDTRPFEGSRGLLGVFADVTLRF